MNPTDYHDLIQQLLDAEISGDDFARLDEELKRNPDALAAYRLFAGIHIRLQRKGEIDAAIQTSPVVPVEQLMAIQKRRVARTSLLAAAAVFVLTGLVLWLTIAPENSNATATFQTTPGSSFNLSHATNSPQAAGNTLSPGSTIRLDHGAIELALPHQVRAILEAPATLTLVNERTVNLKRGRAFFEVRSPDGHGFTVETPYQRIVDLGTAFGVDLPIGSDDTHLHVFEGSVRIEGLQAEAPGETIRAPMALSLQGIRASRQLENTTDRFLRRLPKKIETVFVEDFESGLLANSAYAIHMDSTAIHDHSGNPFAGISGKDPWRFSTSKELRIRNPGFEDARVENGMPVPHWKEVTGAEIGFNTYVQQPKPTEGSLLLHVSPERMLVQDLDVPIRAGSTYLLTLDVGNEPLQAQSQAIVQFFGSDNGFEKPLAELFVIPPEDTWHRSQTLSFTANTQEATGQTLGIALSSRNGRSTFDDLRICEIRNFDRAKSPAVPAIGNDMTGEPDTRPPKITEFDPAPDASNAPTDEIPTLVFDKPVRFGTGRIIVKNLSDGSETELVVGSNRTSLRGRVLSFIPRLGLGEGTEQIGGIPGWEWGGPVSRFNPSGNGARYQHPDLADNSNTRGTLDSMKGPTLVTLGNEGHPGTIRRSLGNAEKDRIYTVSVGIGCRDATHPSPFAGYRIRLLRESAVLAEVSGKKPPGPPNSMTPVGFSWNSGHHPVESTADAPLILEISTLAPVRGQGGHLDIDHVKVTSLDETGN